MRRRRLATWAGPALLISVLGAGAPALAADGGNERGLVAQSAEPQVQRVHRCWLYASAMSFGASCGGGHRGGRALTWAERYLPFVACRYDDLPAGVQTPPDPDGQDGQWLLETCLRDVDLRTADGGPQVHTELQIVWFDAPLPDPRELRPPQMEPLWERFDTVYPAPVLDIAPVARPRVNVPAYFRLAAQTAPVLTKVIDDGVHEITMQAQIDHVSVQPGEGADTAIDCGDGQTPYQPGVPASEQSSTCTYTYRRSSASSPGQTYAVQAHAYWRVTYSYQDRDGVHTTTLGTFDVATIQRLPVQEVQSSSRR